MAPHQVSVHMYCYKYPSILPLRSVQFLASHYTPKSTFKVENFPIKNENEVKQKSEENRLEHRGKLKNCEVLRPNKTLLLK